MNLTDTDVLTFALAGCNAAEVAEFGRIPEVVALARMNRALREYGRGDHQPVLTLAREAA